jgi:hypothetical protein
MNRLGLAVGTTLILNSCFFGYDAPADAMRVHNIVVTGQPGVVLRLPRGD